MTLRRLIAGMAIAALSGCAFPPGLKSTDAEIAAIPRATYDVPGPDHLRISYLHAGTPGGRAVVFVHGTPGSAGTWADMLLHVPKGMEFFAIDRPGFGKTTPRSAQPSLHAQAEALVPLLRRLAPQRPILLGHSYGGPVIVQLVVDHPDLASGLVIAAGALDPAQEHVYAIQRFGAWAPVRSILPSVLSNANSELIALRGELDKLAPGLARVACPIVIVHGTADTNVPYANVPYMRAKFTRVPMLKVITITGANHFLPEEHADALYGAIGDLAS